MAEFGNGVSSYIHGRTTIDVYFPVDGKGKADISCFQCPYYRRTYQTCGLNNKICEYPNKFVGSNCPLKEVKQ